MEIERGLIGAMPYASVGSGIPVVIAAGGWPTTGVDSDRLVKGALAPLRPLLDRRRAIVFNRRGNLPFGMTMAEQAAEYAVAIRSAFGAPVDVVGTSTGGSIVQQLAADHPDVVRRLVLISTACRLGTLGRATQARAATALRAGNVRSAVATLSTAVVPAPFRPPVRVAASMFAGRIVSDFQVAADLATTLEAEDGFDLARCERPIEASTLIIAGGRDRFYSPALFVETAGLIANSRLRLFPRRGHLTVTGDPRARAAIAGFLSWKGANPTRPTGDL